MIALGEVWVTGIGAVTAAGVGVPALIELLLGGESGVRPSRVLGGRPAGHAPAIPARGAGRRLDRSGRFFLEAAEEAWRDAGLDGCAADFSRAGVIEGSSLGPLADLLVEHRGQSAGSDRSPARPSRMIRFMAGAGGATLAQQHGLRGPVFYLSAGSVSSAYAIVEAAQKIAAGSADVMVAGGAECPLHPDIVDSFRGAGILAEGDDESGDCLPFDRRRAGTVLGEGAGVVVLESEAHARRRGARPRAVIAGSGVSGDSHGMTAPDPRGIGVREATRCALEGIRTRLGWIKAHGTGTRLGDAAECAGLAAVLGDGLREVPLTSLKPALGHCLGASAAVETVAAIAALECGLVPPTLGTREVDPALPACRIATGTESSLGASALLLAEGFGGRCVALVLSRAEVVTP